MPEPSVKLGYFYAAFRGRFGPDQLANLDGEKKATGDDEGDTGGDDWSGKPGKVIIK